MQAGSNVLERYAEASFQNQTNFSWNSLFAKSDSTKIKANFCKSSFSSIFELEKHIFISIYCNRSKASIFRSKMSLLAKFQLLPIISRLATPKSAGR